MNTVQTWKKMDDVYYLNVLNCRCGRGDWVPQWPG